MNINRKLLREMRLQKFARILAQKYDIELKLHSIKGLGFCDSTRRIVISEKLSDNPFDNITLQKAVTLHELGHILFTKSSAWRRNDRDISNIIADGRVEESMSRLFPKARLYFTFMNQTLMKFDEDKLRNLDFDKLGVVVSLIMEAMLRVGKGDTGISPLPRKYVEILIDKIGQKDYDWIMQKTNEAVDVSTEQESATISREIESKIREICKTIMGSTFTDTGDKNSVAKSGSQNRKTPEPLDWDPYEDMMKEMIDELDENKEEEDDEFLREPSDEGSFKIDSDDGDEVTEVETVDDDDKEGEPGSDVAHQPSILGDEDKQNGEQNDEAGDFFDGLEEDDDELETEDKIDEIEDEKLEESKELDEESELDDDDIESVDYKGDIEEEVFEEDTISSMLRDEAKNEMQVETDVIRREDIKGNFRAYNARSIEDSIKSNFELRKMVLVPINTTKLEPVANRMAHSFKIIAEVGNGWKHGETKGKLETKRIVRIIKSNGRQPKVFKRKVKIENKDISVVILLDASGSMGNVAMEATESAYTVARALEVCNYDVEVLMFGIDSEEIVGVNSFGQKLIYAKRNFVPISDASTPLYPALCGSHKSLLSRTSARKLVIVITDGEPDSPSSCRSKISELERDGVAVMGILVSNSGMAFERGKDLFYPGRFFHCKGVNMLPYQMRNIIKGTLKTIKRD